jgi:hypothetical protein
MFQGAVYSSIRDVVHMLASENGRLKSDIARLRGEIRSHQAYLAYRRSE